MTDEYGRVIDYMRISVTDRCNMRCMYCMPDGVKQKVSHNDIIRYEEILKIARAASRLGISHIKVTGGEPLVRRGCAELIGDLKKVPGIETVTLTTNGSLLGHFLPDLIRAGVDGINVSLDTTDPSDFQRITGGHAAACGRGPDDFGDPFWGQTLPGHESPPGFPSVGDVISSMLAAADAGIRVKVNTVTLPGTRPEELVSFARERAIDVRFIEMMPIGNGRAFGNSDNRRLLRQLLCRHPDMTPESEGALDFLKESADALFFEGRDSHTKITSAGKKHGPGPAVYFRIPGYPGSVGFISAVHGKFCGTCNRVRLTSSGFLKTCLCYNDGADLRAVIRGGGSSRDLEEAMRQAILKKPAAHCFDRPDQISEKHGMSEIGG